MEIEETGISDARYKVGSIRANAEINADFRVLL